MECGDKICNRLRLVREIGAGTVGRVFEAHDLESGDRVAVKLIEPELRSAGPEPRRSGDLVRRIRSAYSCALRVRHPHVLQVLELIDETGAVGYTMELADGGDLSSRMIPKASLPISDAMKLLRQLSLGLQAIHDAGITHRNLKPENLLVFDGGSLKIGDFMNACGRDGSRFTEEEEGAVVGSIDYLAPEYMLHGQVDWRSDIYALGALAYELVTGESPFVGDSVYATMVNRLKGEPSPPSALRGECPTRLDEIIMRALCREPAARYQSAAEVATDLAELLES